MNPTTYVALLRGINVGGNKTVNMAKLKACFEKLGYTDVKTYINSGNVIFSAPDGDEGKMVEGIERAIKKTFGFEVRVVVRTTAQLKAVCQKIPTTWNNLELRTDVLFLWDEVDRPGVRAEIATTKGVDTLLYTKGAVIWSFARKDYTRSAMHKFIGTHVYKHMTARNINTTRKLYALMSARG